jgi:hypothetical protein
VANLNLCCNARQPKDTVPGDETVRVPKDLINGKEFKGIELGIDTNLSWRCRSQLIKPTELYVGLIFKLS